MQCTQCPSWCLPGRIAKKCILPQGSWDQIELLFPPPGTLCCSDLSQDRATAFCTLQCFAVGSTWQGHKGPLFTPGPGCTMQSFPLVTHCWVSMAGSEALPPLQCYLLLPMAVLQNGGDRGESGTAFWGMNSANSNVTSST